MTGTGSGPRYAITGLGVVAGPQPDKSQRVVAAEAARLAIEDAGCGARTSAAPSTSAAAAAGETAAATRTRFHGSSDCP